MYKPPIMEPWKTPVYNAQCYTFTIAKLITGQTANAIRYDLEAELRDPESGSAIFWFRALPAYRNQAAKILRKRVADYVRADRRIQKGIHADDCELTIADAGRLPYPASCTCGAALYANNDTA